LIERANPLIVDATVLMAKVRSEFVSTVLQFVAGAGGNPSRVRSAAGIRPGDLLDPDRLIDFDVLAAALAHAADDLHDPFFGLHLGANFHLEGLGLVTYAVLNAGTVGIGLQNLVRYLDSLVQGIRPELVTKRGETTLGVAVGLRRAIARHLQEAGTLIMVRLLRRLVGDERWAPRAVVLAHERPAEVAEHVRHFGVVPTFGGRYNEVRFDAALLRREVLDADRSLVPIIEQRLQEVLGVDAHEEPWLRDLRFRIASRLCDGHPRLAALAPDVGLSARTLQRRLGDRGLVWRDIVRETRLRLAKRYLEESDTDLTEVAFLLGYAEQSAFTHAFRRWTRKSPGAHRRAHRGRAGRVAATSKDTR
jgi:AraC-like DNA-binding protein